jgi:hypothetical protein
MNRLAKFVLFVIFLIPVLSFADSKSNLAYAVDVTNGVNLDLACDGPYLKIKDIVANPKAYKGKKVKFLGDFYSFSSLPLDYPPAMREAKNYIGIVLARPDHKQIPLVELKLAVKLDIFKNAEERLSLEQGDTLRLSGRVFEVALGEPWLDITSIEVVKKVTKKEK